jgi:diacylglycerol kinase (ATP)
MRVTLIHNPASGDDDHAREHLIDLIARAGHQVTYYSSTGDWRSALDEPPDLLAVAGGDGTVRKAAHAVSGRKIPIAILPTGTANNVAGYLGLSGIPHDVLVDGWANGSLQAFDLGVVHGTFGTHRFLESVGVGVVARLIAEVDTGRAAYVNELDGREARINAALDLLERVLRRSTPVPCEIELDDHRFSGEYLLIEILNFGAAGPNLQLAPHADGADGVLDIAIVEAHERAWLEQHLSDIRTSPSNLTPWRVRHARRVGLRCQPCTLHVDDKMWEPDGRSAALDATVEHAALTFVVPATQQDRHPFALG